MPDSPAAKAGLKGGSESVTVNGQDYILGGDIIAAIDGKPVLSSEQLTTIIDKRPGDQITVTVLRDGKSRQVKDHADAAPDQHVSTGYLDLPGGQAAALPAARSHHPKNDIAGRAAH